MSSRMGRPPLDNPKSERITMRVTPDEKTEIMQFSKESKKGLLELLKIGIKTVKKK